ncbi:MAG: glycosyltransferase family 39 protein [Opitutaceae bacterium]|jgi:4-amino-4-deoxy-L-arabinose transferase-like glycosyltransferase|nr:glycosyltransferase family 39 protein [Opitutaceae bacterium]
MALFFHQHEFSQAGRTGAGLTGAAMSAAAAAASGERRAWRRDLTLLAALGAVWFFAVLGFRPLNNPDEGRYAEIPREMAASGDFVTPRLNGVKYFEKPPLLYWLSAATFRVAGVNEFTARFWNALFALGGVLATYAAARVLYGRRAGWWAAVVLATSLLYFGLSQMVLLDMALAAAMAGALFAFLLAVRRRRGGARAGLFMVFYACMALAVLTKGLVGLVLPCAVAFAWVAVCGQWRELWPAHVLGGAAVFLAIAAPWHALAALENCSPEKERDFAWFYFVHEHFLRYTTRVHGRVQPWWFFAPVLIGGFLPWAAFGAQALRRSLAGGWRARRENREGWFFVLWVVVVAVFFSMSQSKLIPYILPVFPALAVPAGRWLAEEWAARRVSPGLRRGVLGFAVFALALAAGAAAWPVPPKYASLAPVVAPWRWVLAGWLGGGAVALLAGVAVVAGNAGRSAAGAGAGGAAAGAAAGAAGKENEKENENENETEEEKEDGKEDWGAAAGAWVPRGLIAGVGATFAVLFVAFNPLAGCFDVRGTKSIALALAPVLRPGDEVFVLGEYPQDLPVYLGRTVNVVDYAGELEFGIRAEPHRTASRFIDGAAFRVRWGGPGVVYAVLRRRALEEWFPDPAARPGVLAESARFVLVSNQRGGGFGGAGRAGRLPDWDVGRASRLPGGAQSAPHRSGGSILLPSGKRDACPTSRRDACPASP